MLRRLARIVLLLAAGAAAGCGSPLLHGIAAPDRAAADPGIVGAWVTADPAASTQIRAEIVAAPDAARGAYAATLTVHHDGTLRTTLSLELSLLDVGGVRCADLMLARAARDELVERYGFLVLPVHQVVRLDRTDDELRLAMLNEAWIRAHGSDATRDRMAVGGGEITVITAPAADVARLLTDHAAEDGVFGEPFVLRRAAAR